MGKRNEPIDIELKAVRGAAWRQAGYTLLFLALQAFMLHAVWTADNPDDEATSTLRLALALQVAFSVAVGLAGYRVREYLLVHQDRVDRKRADAEGMRGAARQSFLTKSAAERRPYLRIGCWLLVAAGVVSFGEVWAMAGPVDLDDPGLQRIAHPWIAAVWLLLVAAGALLLVGVRYQVLPLTKLTSALSWREGIRTKVEQTSVGSGDPMQSASLAPSAAPGKRPHRIITCSGGGIRSASFCLGALQALTKARIYHGSDAVVGVSGGGYMAAAFHYVGRRLGPDAVPPFAHGTGELALLRRHSRYLLPNPVEIFRGVLSIIWGVVINLAIIAVVIRAVAWVLGWHLHHFDIVVDKGDHLVVSLPTLWIIAALAPWAVAVGGFVLLDKVLERFATMPDGVRRGMHKAIKHGLELGTATAVLMLGVPLTLRALDKLAGKDGTLPDAILRITEPGGWAAGTIVGTITALITLGRTVWKGLEDAQPKTGRLAKLVARARTVLAPWVGTVIIVAVIFVLLVRWTEGYATSPAWRADWQTGLAFAAIFLAVRVLTDANRTSLHHFYRERLASAYLLDRDPAAAMGDQARAGSEPKAKASSYQRPMRVSEIAKANGGGGPELVMVAVANVSDADFVPAGRGCVPFVISASETGIAGDRSLPPHGTQPTRAYEDFADYDGRDLTVPAAMAISGAAFSPLVGRESARTRPVRVLLTVLNARLGVWLPNPYLSPPSIVAEARAAQKGPKVWAARFMSISGKPGPYRLLREAFGSPSLNDRKLYITDGGHYDNLGLLEALRRRPEEIYVIDASNDKKDGFGTLADAIATARMDLGVEISMDVSRMRCRGEDRPARAWATGTATYDDGATTTIHFLKAIMLDGLCNDLDHYAAENPDFPRRSTGRQLYDEWDFEAYRELGESLAERMIASQRLLTPPAPRPGSGSVTDGVPAS